MATSKQLIDDREHPRSGSAADPRGRLLTVDALRAIAAIMVLLLHSGLHFGSEPLLLLPAIPIGVIGGTGVGLFLVISGFSIHLRWAARPDASRQFSFRGFWARRFWRLYPTYYVALAVSVVLLALVVDRYFAKPSPWVIRPGGVPLWVQILLATTVVGGSVVPIKFLGAAWSLALEEHIYFVYALALRNLRRVRPLWWLAAAFIVSVVWGVAVQAVTTSVPPYQFLDQVHSTFISRVFYAQLPPAGSSGSSAWSLQRRWSAPSTFPGCYAAWRSAWPSSPLRRRCSAGQCFTCR